ncbi:hypothetical protein CISG_08672 [Coccidioides immitis RMSCC 3703]|uniref:Uncharacterized protein n=1 Tax=Coccidioides immitis RMSCC 3703 TaxID=454286 RepID=A0A0J8R6S6_COCIT|nr:hypothetical protein CISG_08672 [Coccidioides immitis RMSCC 3703]
MPESSAMKKSPKRRKTSSNDKADKDVIIGSSISTSEQETYTCKNRQALRDMFHDKDFSRNAAVDRYGRKLRRDDTKKQLEKFYRLDKDDVEGQISADDDEEVQKELLRVEKEDYDPARDGGFSESSSSEESSSDEESEAKLQDEAAESGQLDSQTGGYSIGRDHGTGLLGVNLDWDNNPLRYFYAVLTCSSKDAAKHIYDTVDGTEYMSSANFFDLRFVPESTDFAEDVPRDECNRIPDGYKPNEFVTDALQHSKVKLTWDTDDKARKDAQARAFKGGKKEIDENDLKAYLGSDSSDSEEEHVEVVDSTEAAGASTKLSKKEAERARIRALLGLSNDAPSKAKEKGPVGDMEVTFAAGLTAAPARDSVFENEPEKEETTREKYIRKERERKQRRKAKLKAAKSGTVPEIDADKPTAESKEEEDLGFDDPFFTAPELDSAKVAAKRKEEKRKQRQQREADGAASAAQRAELELLMMDDKTSTIKHFDMNEIEKAQKRAKKAGKHRKGKKDEATMPVDDFKVDVKDPRFQRIYESHEYAIDPTNPRFRQTDGMKALLEEGRKRRRHLAHDEPDGDAVEPIKKKKRGKTAGPDRMPETEDLSKLVEQVKAKAKMV